MLLDWPMHHLSDFINSNEAMLRHNVMYWLYIRMYIYVQIYLILYSPCEISDFLDSPSNPNRSQPYSREDHWPRKFVWPTIQDSEDRLFKTQKFANHMGRQPHSSGSCQLWGGAASTSQNISPFSFSVLGDKGQIYSHGDGCNFFSSVGSSRNCTT